jgi:DNA-binding SARP family transcriptional activator/streptogramin lyase
MSPFAKLAPKPCQNRREVTLAALSARLELHLLGPLEILGPDGAVRPPGEKPAAVLGFLALHADEVVSRDRLVDALWDDDPPASAAASLQMHVSKARKLLDEAGAGRDRLTTYGNGYVLHLETDELDAWRFRAHAAEGRRLLHDGDPAAASRLLGEALDLWHGDLLDGVAALAFVAAERSRFRELRLEALEDRFEAELELGHHANVVAELEHAVAAEPHRDRLRELAMLALYRCGRQTDALDLYRSGRHALSDELGLEPSPRLRQLEQAILRHDSSLELALPPPPAPPRTSRRPAAITMGIAAFVAVGVLVVAVELRGGGSVSAAPNSVAVLDGDGRLVSDVRVGDQPSAFAVGSPAVWVLNQGDGTVTRIDPRTLAVRTLGVGTSANAVAYGEHALWVGSDRGLLRVDPATGDTTAVSLGRERTSVGTLVPRGVTGLVAGPGIWATAGHGALFRVSSNGRARRDPTQGVAPTGPFTYADGALWSAGSGVLQRLDLRYGITTPVVVDRDVPNGFGGSALPEQAASGNGFVWVTAPYTHQVVAVSPHTLQVDAAAAVPGRPVSVAFGLGAVWVGTLDGSVSRVDPATATVTRTVRVGGPVSALAVGDGRVWAAVDR